MIAPLPNFICGRLASPDDFGAEGGGNALLDFGKFVTGGLVVMGIGKTHSWQTERLLPVACRDGEFSSANIL